VKNGKLGVDGEVVSVIGRKFFVLWDDQDKPIQYVSSANVYKKQLLVSDAQAHQPLSEKKKISAPKKKKSGKEEPDSEKNSTDNDANNDDLTVAKQQVMNCVSNLSFF
jgi:hypothetical protein